MLPILLWSVFYLFLLHQFSLHTLISIVWSPQGLVHLWFLYMLIGLYLLSPIVSLLFNTGQYVIIKFTLGLWFVFASVNIYTDAFMNVRLGEWFGLFTNYQAGFIGYYILGAYIMSHGAISLRKSILITIIGLVVTYGLVLWDNYSSTSFNDRMLNFLAPNIVVLSYGVFSMLRCFDFSWFNTYNFAYISPLVIGIYLSHEMALKFFREYLGLVGNGFNAIYFIPLLAISTFIVALIISFILSKVQGKHKLFF